MQPCVYCGELTDNGCDVIAVVACDRHHGADTRAFAEMHERIAALEGALRAEQELADHREYVRRIDRHDFEALADDEANALHEREIELLIRSEFLRRTVLADGEDGAFTAEEREAILSGSLTVPRSVVERAAVEQARAVLAGREAGAEDEPWCTEDHHIVLPSGEACVCGENPPDLLR